jgi:L-seryl-tRNA(Ser) seleniumtransferase
MRIPGPFKDLLPVEAVKQLSQLVAQPALISALKDAAQKLGWKDTLQASNIQHILQQTGKWMESVSEPWLRNAQPGLTPGINATGELFSSRWCTHRLGTETVGTLHQLHTQYAETTKLDTQLNHLLMGMTSAPSVLIVPNISIALYLAACTDVASGKGSQWVLPRVDCIRLPQSGTTPGGNVRAILDQAKVRTIEIGTMQDCERSDFSEALTSLNGVLLMASPNALAIESRREHRRSSIDVAVQQNASIIEILMDGSLHDLSELGVPSRVLSESWEKNVELVIVPGDAFLGGPGCGILLGKNEILESITKMADSLGWQASSDTKAALLRTLQASTTLQDWKQLPIGASLSTSLDNLDHRAKRLATQLAMHPSIERVAIEKKSFRIGAGVWSSVRLESAVVQLFPKSISASALAEQFASAPVPVWSNVQSDHVEFVMRTIEPDEDRWIVKVD